MAPASSSSFTDASLPRVAALDSGVSLSFVAAFGSAPFSRSSRTASGLPLAAAPIKAIADEDLERSNADKTSAVHFLRFELDADAVAALREGAALRLEALHPHYQAQFEVSGSARAALLRDLD